MTKITKYTILIFLVALQVVYLIEIIERVILNKWSDIFFPTAVPFRNHRARKG